MMESPMLSGSCRCCASEGAYKDVKSSYHWMGEEEIYADMLKDCFDISLSSPSDGQEEGGICEICITQLRNAANFRKQVLHTEEQFKNRLQIGIFKPELVKVEIPGEDENDSDDNNASADEVYSGPEFEVPIKSESPEEPKPKKRAAKKATTTRAKKAKTDDAETSTKRRPPSIKFEKVEITVGKLLSALEHTSNVNETKHEEKGYETKILSELSAPEPTLNTDNQTKRRGKGNKTKEVTELAKHRTNIQTIREWSNATPIKNWGDVGYACCFCTESFHVPADLKRHTLSAHDDKTKKKFSNGSFMYNYLVRLDITSLCCMICDAILDTLEQLTAHLTEAHAMIMYNDIKSHILPFAFDDQDLRCVICRTAFNKFRGLTEHMAMHYRNFICGICDAGFVNRASINRHVEVHQTGTFKCNSCPKVYKTLQNKKSHEKSTHIFRHMLKKCGYCKVKFNDYRKKGRHLAEVHGIRQREKKSLACDKTFEYQSDLTNHTK